MGLYPGGLKSWINFALESEWAYTREDLFWGILRYTNKSI